MKKRTNKGFTLTELIIVVVIIGILAAVLIPTLTACVKKAKISNDKQLVRNLNLALSADSLANHDGEKHKTMQEALDAVDDAGYNVAKINATKVDNEILWDSKNDVFCYLNDGDIEYIPSSVSSGYELNDDNPVDAVKLWQIVKLTSGDLKGNRFSVYAAPGSAINPIITNKGFDAGTLQFPTVSYDRTGAEEDSNKHEVVIRTNGGGLTINAKIGNNSLDSDTVTHYGFAESVSIKQIYEASYHEYGSTYQIDINKGRVVLESTSQVWSIHLNANSEGDGYEKIVIATTEGVKLPDIVSRDSVTVEENIIMVELQQLNNKGEEIAEKTEEVWILVSNGIADKDATQNEQVDSVLGQKFLETGTQTNVVSNKEETMQQAKLHSIKVDDTTYEITSKADLILFQSLVNGGQDFTGCTVNLKADIDLGNMDWEPIGYLTYGDYSSSTSYSSEHRKDNSELGGLVLTDSKPFCGIFNGNGHTISNFKPVEFSGGYGTGLFGLLYGRTYNSELFSSQSAKDLMMSNSTIQSGLLSDTYYSCVVKDLSIGNVSVGSENYDIWFIGGIAGIAYSCNISNCNIKNFNSQGAGISGGIAGTVSASVIQNCTNGTNNALGHIDAIQNAGGIVGTLENYFYVGGRSHTIIYKCVNNCEVSVQSTNAGGIVGLAQGYTNSAIIDCENNGNILINRVSGDKVYNAAGIAANGASISLFYHCTNNGSINGPSYLEIEQPESSKGLQLGGIAAYMTSGYFYNCVNNGNISGNANYMGGIVSATHDSNNTLTLVNCGNNGVISNSFASGMSSSICSAGSAVIQIVGTIDKLSYVQEYLNQLSSNVDLTQVTVLDKENGELVMPSTGCSNITLNDSICNSIVINGSNKSKITINCPNVDVMINGNISSTDIVVEESKSVQITSSGSCKGLCVKNVTSIINNGTITSLAFYGQDIETPINVVNNGTISRDDNYAVTYYAQAINKSASNIVVHFMNNGTIAADGPYAMGISQGSNNLLVIHTSATSTISTKNGDKTGNGNLGLAFNANGAIIFSKDPNATMNCSSYIHENANGSYSTIADSDFGFGD